MSDNILHGDIEAVATQMFDVCVNPLAGMICTFLQLQVSKGIISHDEAKAVIASSLDLINQSEHSADVLKNGHEMLVRMISAIDRIGKS